MPGAVPVVSLLPPLADTPTATLALLWSMGNENEPAWRSLLLRSETLTQPEMERAALDVLTDTSPSIMDRLRNESNACHVEMCRPDLPDYARENFAAHKARNNAIVAKLIERRDAKAAPQMSLFSR